MARSHGTAEGAGYFHGRKRREHGDHGEDFMLLSELLSDRVIGLAIEVHRHTGPCLLGSVYEQCLCCELREADISFAGRVTILIVYKGTPVGDSFKVDTVVAHELILEIKAVAAILPIHEVRLRAYLRMSGIHVGLLLNFNVPRLVDGLRRYVV
jgi:GxxExxY protein